MLSRYFARARAMSPLSRNVAIPQESSREAASPSEKINSFFFNELAEASGDNHSHGQAIACMAPDGLLAGSSCWEEKSIHEAARRGLSIEDRRLKIACAARKAFLCLRASALDPLQAPSWAHHQSSHNQRGNINDHRRNDRQSEHHHRKPEDHQRESGDHQSQSGEARRAARQPGNDPGQSDEDSCESD